MWAIDPHHPPPQRTAFAHTSSCVLCVVFVFEVFEDLATAPPTCVSVAVSPLAACIPSEYYRSVEEERARMERRKAVLKAQEQQLNDAFQVDPLSVLAHRQELLCRNRRSGWKGEGLAMGGGAPRTSAVVSLRRVGTK